MGQQIWQSIYGSFLLTLMFSLIAITSSIALTMYDCDEFITSEHCHCLRDFVFNMEIQCPAMVQNPKIKIKIFNNGETSIMHFTCNQFDDVEYQLLPVLNGNPVKEIVMKDCPLPSKPLSLLFGSLGIRKLFGLEFENYNLTSNITRKHFSGLRALRKLVLDVTDLSFIEEDIFTDLRNLVTLRIYSSKISLAQNIFSPLVNLKRLHLEVGNLQQLPECTFHNQRMLKSQDLCNPSEISLPQNIFSALVKLEYLNLRVRNLQQLPVGIFHNQRMLIRLDLNNTPLHNISKDYFQGAESIEFLILSSNGITNFQSDVFALLTRLIYIDLSNNNFRYLPTELFAHNEILRGVIMVNSTSLEALPSGLFANLQDFHTAHITCNDTVELLSSCQRGVCINCGLIEIPFDLFANSSMIKSISLAKNKLVTLPENIFKNQRLLKYLDLSHNKLNTLPEKLFLYTNLLAVLNLSYNNLTEISRNLFSTLDELEEVNLSNNRIKIIDQNAFQFNKNSIRNVYMENNRIEMTDAFENLVKLKNLNLSNNALHHTLKSNRMADLEVLDLSHNFIASLNYDDSLSYSSDLLKYSSRIKSISLAKNNLVKLPESMFKHHRILQYLDLSHNKLNTLPEKLFLYTRRLTVLNLSYNNLTEISRNLVSTLDELQEVNLSNNRIIIIDQNAFQFNKNSILNTYMENNRINMTDAFENLVKLKILNLSNNALRHILRSNRMADLEVLDLSHNLIASLNYDDLLPYSRNNLSINLNSNRISKINMTSKIQPYFFSEELFLSVKLNYNPLDCDCNLLPFLKYTRGDLSEIPYVAFKFDISELVCNKPDRMKNLSLLGLEPKLLMCTFDFEKFEPLHCPLGCECWERSYDSVLLVNCSSNNLTEMPALPHVQPLGLKSIELHVENNELNELPAVVSSHGYRDVTRIYAAANKFSHINVNNLPEHLVYLDLSRNNFKGLNVDELDFFKRNSSLKIALSENPWSCDCESKPLRQFIWQCPEMIIDIGEMYCDSPKNMNMIEYFNTKDICRDTQDGQDKQDGLLTSILNIILVVCILIAITAALYYKYQTEVKIWLYKHNCCSWWVNEEELDRNKTYDAFVCYSNKDEEFVVGQLVPQLEKGPIRFKLCVHVRDFIVGGIIPDQIIRAIADSRRAIVVLFKNFIKSEWALMEFRLAHQAGLDEKRAKVIAIVYGEIGDISSLDLELQAYIKMTTYLEWGNPWFWDRLRYIMPHPIRRNDTNEMELNELSTAQNAMEADG